jgi:arylsulfatase A-like enzyme
MADIMPTLCEAMGAEIPNGVQGRSLWPLLQGQSFPREEFRSIYSGVGLGGLYYADEDKIPTSISHDASRSGSWDELNKVTLSGNQKMVRMDDWKLVYDMMGHGQLYNLRQDPFELTNLFNKPQHVQAQARLMAELVRMASTKRSGQLSTIGIRRTVKAAPRQTHMFPDAHE